MHKKNLVMAVAASLGSLATAGPAIAQETTVFEPVIVTAQKREQNIYEVPVAISASAADDRKAGHYEPDGHWKVRPEPERHRILGRPYVLGQSFHSRHRPAGPPDHDRPGRGRLRGRRLPGPPGRPELEPGEYRARRGAARPAGHAVRAQFHRRRHQHHHAAAGRRGRRPRFPLGGSRGRLNAGLLLEYGVLGPACAVPTGAISIATASADFLQLENPPRKSASWRNLGARPLKWSPTDQLSFLLTADGNEGDSGLRPYDTLIDEVPSSGPIDLCKRQLLRFWPLEMPIRPRIRMTTNTGQDSQTSSVPNEANGVSLTVDFAFSDTMAAPSCS